MEPGTIYLLSWLNRPYESLYIDECQCVCKSSDKLTDQYLMNVLFSMYTATVVSLLEIKLNMDNLSLNVLYELILVSGRCLLVTERMIIIL